MAQQWNWGNPGGDEHRRIYQHQADYLTPQGYSASSPQNSRSLATASSQPPLPSTYVHAINHGQYSSHSSTSPLHNSTSASITYTDSIHEYLLPNYSSPYHLSPNTSPSFRNPEYTSRPTSIASNGSPSSDFLDDFEDDSLGSIYYTDSGTGVPRGHQSYASGSTHPQAGTSPYYMCDHPGCNKVCARLCDLRKHRKRHQKPFPCREGCDSYFSTEKDRDRHERSRHRQEERLTCVMCGHRTARKDNMKDHVRRRHGEQELEQIMDATMANAYPN